MQRRDRDGAELDERAPDAPPRHQPAPLPATPYVGPDYHVEIGALNYKSIASILAHNLDRRPAAPATGDAAIVHTNIRGPRYFH